jgi:hypothetical protein
LYAEYFGPVEMMTFRSPGKGQEKSILLPVYLDNDLESIRAAAENPVMLEKFTDLDYVLAGYAFMQAGSMDTAKQMLEKVKKDTEQYPAAAWYLGLISLNNNQTDKCISYMRQAAESLVFMDEAQAILQELQEKR